MMKGADGQVHYVGKARSLRKRLQQWFGQPARSGPWSERMIAETTDLEYVVVDSEADEPFGRK